MIAAGSKKRPRDNCVSQRGLCLTESCQTCHNKSFAGHPRAKYWHPTKNGNTKPRYIFKNTNKKFWFTCGECGHDFITRLSTVNQKNSWCSYCAKPPQRLCSEESCQLWELYGWFLWIVLGRCGGFVVIRVIGWASRRV